MDSKVDKMLVIIARFGEEAVGSGSKVEYSSMAEEPIDYKVDWG